MQIVFTRNDRKAVAQDEGSLSAFAHATWWKLQIGEVAGHLLSSECPASTGENRVRHSGRKSIVIKTEHFEVSER